MTHSRISNAPPRSLRLAALASVVLVTACGSPAAVELPTAQIDTVASTSEATTDARRTASTDGPQEAWEVRAPEVDASTDDGSAGHGSTDDDGSARDGSARDGSARDGSAGNGSAGEGSTGEAPTPKFDEPDLVVDENGCVTDRNLGLVIMCEDPAAGPDEGLG